MSWIIIAKTVLELLPALLEAIKAIESAIPESGSGKQKAELVRGALQAAYEVGGKSIATFEQIWPALQATIGVAVSTFNSIGVFKK